MLPKKPKSFRKPAAAAKAPAEQLAEKQAALDARRLAKAIDEVREVLLADDSKAMDIVQEPSTETQYIRMLRLVAAFGCDACHGEFVCASGPSWDKFGAMESIGEVPLLPVWRQLRERIAHTLTYQLVGDAPKCSAAARHTCELLCLDWQDILQKHIDAIPEPKSWQQLRAQVEAAKPAPAKRRQSKATAAN